MQDDGLPAMPTDNRGMLADRRETTPGIPCIDSDKALIVAVMSADLPTIATDDMRILGKVAAITTSISSGSADDEPVIAQVGARIEAVMTTLNCTAASIVAERAGRGAETECPGESDASIGAKVHSSQDDIDGGRADMLAVIAGKVQRAVAPDTRAPVIFGMVAARWPHAGSWFSAIRLGRVISKFPTGGPSSLSTTMNAVIALNAVTSAGGGPSLNPTTIRLMKATICPTIPGATGALNSAVNAGMDASISAHWIGSSSPHSVIRRRPMCVVDP